MITGFGEQYSLNLLKLSVLHGGKMFVFMASF